MWEFFFKKGVDEACCLQHEPHAGAGLNALQTLICSIYTKDL
jgi:hypothetical protein